MIQPPAPDLVVLPIMCLRYPPILHLPVQTYPLEGSAFAPTLAYNPRGLFPPGRSGGGGWGGRVLALRDFGGP